MFHGFEKLIIRNDRKGRSSNGKRRGRSLSSHGELYTIYIRECKSRSITPNSTICRMVRQDFLSVICNLMSIIMPRVLYTLL